MGRGPAGAAGLTCIIMGKGSTCIIVGKGLT